MKRKKITKQCLCSVTLFTSSLSGSWFPLCSWAVSLLLWKMVACGHLLFFNCALFCVYMLCVCLCLIFLAYKKVFSLNLKIIILHLKSVSTP